MKDEQKKYYLTFIGIIVVGLAIFSFSSEATNIYLLFVAASTAAALVLIAKRVDSPSGEDFAPYHITILPELKPIVDDFKLLENEMGWDDIWKSMHKSREENEGYHVALDGISFSVLQKQPQQLVFHTDKKYFSTEVKREERIESIALKVRDRNKKQSNHESGMRDYIIQDLPRIYVREGVSGYEVGISTPDSSRKIGMVGDDAELIELITIPYSFSTEELKKTGWKEDEATKSLREDVLYHVPFQYDSKYFSVSISYI